MERTAPSTPPVEPTAHVNPTVRSPCTKTTAMSGQMRFRLSGQTRPVTSVAFNDKSDRLFAGSKDGTVKVWDVRQRQELWTYRGHSSGVRGIALSHDGKWLASTSDAELRIWDARQSPTSQALSGHSGLQ